MGNLAIELQDSKYETMQNCVFYRSFAVLLCFKAPSFQLYANFLIIIFRRKTKKSDYSSFTKWFLIQKTEKKTKNAEIKIYTNLKFIKI